MRDYPMLMHFFGAYLHQDWADEFPDEWAAADEFVGDEPYSVAAFVAEMEQLLANCPEEQQLSHKLLDDFGAAAMMKTWDGSTGTGCRRWPTYAEGERAPTSLVIRDLRARPNCLTASPARLACTG